VATLALTHNSFSDLGRNILEIGVVAGCETSARHLSERLDRDLSELATELAEAPRIPVYYDGWPDPPITIGRGSYLDSLITIAGGRNVFGSLEAPSPRVSLEAIVRADPTLVITSVAGAEDARASIQGRPGWSNIPAVAASRVVTVDAYLVSRLGPRIADAARALAQAIHPDLARPASPAPAVQLECRP
jgi:ABC-type Fe3+-hydroxamate transport system substrate-binding protein